MKKIKLTNNIYHQYKKINEDENINTSTNTEDDFDAINISLSPNILDKLKNSIKTDAVKEDTFIRIKMTHDFFDTIYFPQATPNLKRLMEFVDFPGYLKDLGDRLDSDPKVNASNAIDYAAAAFMNTEFSLDPSTNIRRNNSANESYNYINEAIPSMADVGAAAGELGVEIGQGIANGIFFANIPEMTDKGTFIINGIEKFVISQIVRAPGAYILNKSQIKLSNKKKINTGYICEMLPSKGTLLNF